MVTDAQRCCSEEPVSPGVRDSWGQVTPRGSDPSISGLMSLPGSPHIVLFRITESDPCIRVITCDRWGRTVSWSLIFCGQILVPELPPTPGNSRAGLSLPYTLGSLHRATADLASAGTTNSPRGLTYPPVWAVRLQVKNGALFTKTRVTNCPGWPGIFLVLALKSYILGMLLVRENRDVLSAQIPQKSCKGRPGR